MLSKFASLFRGKFGFKNQVSFQKSSSFHSTTLGWILSFIILCTLPQCYSGEVINSLLQMKKLKLEGPHYLPKMEEVINGQRRPDLSPLAFCNTLSQPQFLFASKPSGRVFARPFTWDNIPSAQTGAQQSLCFVNMYPASPLSMPHDLFYSKN